MTQIHKPALAPATKLNDKNHFSSQLIYGLRFWYGEFTHKNQESYFMGREWDEADAD